MAAFKTCNKCGVGGLIWKQSKKGNWYLATETTWQGDMYGAIRTFYPAHKCQETVIEEPRERDACYWADMGMWRGV
jgi:hypothetical protein